MEQISLKAQKRTVLGRKVKTLRREGLIPAHVFGHKVKTEHIQVKAGEFLKVFEKAGETGIIDLAIGDSPREAGKKKPVLVKNLQVHPATDQPLHIDFYQVNLSEKVKVDVPLEIAGEAPAAQKKIGLLLTPVSELEIEALPTDIPEKIEVDVSALDEVGKEVKVKDLKVNRAKIEIYTEEELVVAQIGELVTREMEETEAEIEAEQAEAAPAEGEAAPGEPRAEGREAKAEGEEKGITEGTEKTQGTEAKAATTGPAEKAEEKKE